MKLPRFMIFVVVGAIGFVVDAGVLELLSRVVGLEVHVARLGSFLAASGTTWRLNRRYVFGHSGGNHNQLVEWLRYLWSSAAGGLVNYGTFSLLIALTDKSDFYRVLGVAAGSCAGMMVNFALYSRYVFRQRVSQSELG